MELYQLKTFVAVAEEGNFTRAGKRVHASQPAVSAHIKALEDELGVRLFDRVARGVELTHAGEELVHDAIEVLAAANTLEARAVTLGGAVTGQMTLGLCADPKYLKVSGLLNQIGERFPRLNLKLAMSPSGTVLNEIRARNMDAGFVFSGNPYGDLTSIKLADPLYCVMGAAHMEQDLAKAGPEELSAYTWVVATSNSPLRELQVQLFNKYGIIPAQIISVNSEELMRPLVVEGKALGVMRDDEADTLLALNKGAECPLLGRHSLEMNFVYRKSQAEDPSMVMLIDIVRKEWGLED
ncbi:LysR family transcriptional regulator [Pseudodesulfovibrio sp. JC047]|uniref:LysR family transcriptional regulator n=1 Tax=Pseudodesulfovibrio sp. JC047 TaxID=2683199 RepID=UPI0013D52055|nr:LysR family transcriptional regulator [Pseudodesulfovibrio sp. JC047]NDV18216.1 LysR family transcriptional regulator [Pseudodesulfovibrio sp. JC047]